MKYRALLQSFVEQYDKNHQLNIGKKKELVVDRLQCKKRPPNPITIRREKVELVEAWTGLDLQHWGKLFFLKRFRSFNVGNRLLEMFYQAVVAKDFFLTMVCWGWGKGGYINPRDANKLNKMVRKASSVEEKEEAWCYPRKPLTSAQWWLNEDEEHVQPQTHPSTAQYYTLTLYLTCVSFSMLLLLLLLLLWHLNFPL